TKTAVVSGVDITTTSDVDYYSFTAPQGTNSSVTITAQSAGLSLLAPTLTVYNANQTVAGTVSGAGQYGTTLQLTLNNVTEGQQFYVKVAGADTSAFGTGRYALTLNMGSGATPAVPLPNTQVLNGDPLSAGGGQAMLLSIEGQVNSYSAGDQKADGARAVGMDAAGNYVVVWSSNGQDGGGWGVYGRRYTVGGVPLGGEFRVNTTTAGDQNTPAVAVNADGSFVVVWQSNGQDGGGWGIYARRYDAAGNALGGEFRVNTTTAGDQKTPAVAVDATGDFVVTWSSNGQDGGGWGIYGQRYDAAGNALGGEFRVNTTTAGDQKDPQVAMAAAGDFVVVWVSNNQDGDKAGVYGQRYSANGTALGGEFQANTYTTGDQNSPALAMDAAGDFVVTWSSNGQDGRGWGVYGRRYDANGVAGNAFHVSNTTAGDQEFTTVAMDAAGNFVIGWSSHGQDGNGWGSYGRQFNLAGIALGNEFQIASSTAGDQVSPTWAVDSNGHAVAVWSGSGMAADSSGVFMQRFALSVGDNANALDGDYTPPGASTVGLPCCCPGCRGTAAAGQDPTGSLAANGTAGHTGMPGCTCPSCMGAVTNGSVVRGELDQLSSQPREPLAAPLALGALAPGFADTVVAPMSLPTKATTDAARFVLPPPLQDAFAVATSPSAIQASATRATDVPPSWVRSTGDGRSGLMMVRRLGLVAGNEEDTRVRTSLERTPGWRSVALWPRVCSESFADVSWLDEPVPDANNAAEEGTVPGLSSALIAGLAAALVIPPSGEGLPADGRDRRPDLQPRSD
ncbi:MAG TPA: hypothetical protein VEL76_14565, partial [Gemmataceae bacterium]|nr:hypothetical protein [Gemmataceae bacterium]